MATYYTNADGLVQRYGTYDSVKISGETNTDGRERQITLNITATELSTAATTAQLYGGAVIPTGSIITEAKIYVTTLFTGGGTLDVGLYNAASLAVIADNAIDAAVAVTGVLDTLGEVVSCDGAYVATTSGATAIAADAVVACSYNTTAFTAGAATIIIKYIPLV